jgi:5-deoxy-5-amino-3-dehydroquinate synthase
MKETDMNELLTVMVPLADRTYRVVVGHGARAQLPGMIPSGVRRVAVVTQSGMPFALETGRDSIVIEIGHGEHHKTLSTIERLCREFAAFGLTRNDLVIGFGGGMVTDVAGFAAAAYHRGIAVMHVSTTLLGMVDAAIGGKTGVNLPEGKNLVGAFWQPSGVICDLDALASLPEREIRCGHGEMAKYHFLTGENLSALPLAARVARCVEIKSEVVASDERESGRRALLNYGHTLAHALEIATDHQIAHGEAVAIGLVFAAHLAESMGRIDAERVSAHYAVVHGEYGLSTAIPEHLKDEELLELMGRDKKALDGLTFVLDGPAGIEVVPQVSPDAVLIALAEMRHSTGSGSARTTVEG